jgi:hypothetical protein
MKALCWVGIVLLIFGVASLAIPIPHDDSSGISGLNRNQNYSPRESIATRELCTHTRRRRDDDGRTFPPSLPNRLTLTVRSFRSGTAHHSSRKDDSA